MPLVVTECVAVRLLEFCFNYSDIYALALVRVVSDDQSTSLSGSRNMQCIAVCLMKVVFDPAMFTKLSNLQSCFKSDLF